MHATPPSNSNPLHNPSAHSPPPAAICTLIRAGNLQHVLQNLDNAVLPSGEWARDPDGHTPLHWAAMSESTHILRAVLSKAAQRRQVDVVSDARPQKGQTPLHWACVAGRMLSVQILLEHGADPHVVDGKGYNAATHAVQYGRVDLLYILLEAYPDLIAATDYEGHTLLQWASYYDHHPAVVFLLMVYHVDPNVADSSGMTPLHRTAQRDKSIVLTSLLEAGADWNLTNNDGKTPLQLAQSGSRAERTLMQWQDGTFTTDHSVPKRNTLYKFRFVIFYYILLVLSYNAYHVHVISGDVLTIGIVPTAIMHVCLIIAFIAHSICTYSDPGEVNKGTIDEFVEYIKSAIVNDQSERYLVPTAYCYTCLAQRPPRSKHSRERNCCVKRFDHECPWINNSVGLKTHKYLLILIIANIISEWIFVGAMVLSMRHDPAIMWVGAALSERPLSCLLIFVQLTISLFCGSLLVHQVHLILKGRTTYEHIMAKRHKNVDSRYDMGMWQNLLSFITSTGPGTDHSATSFSVLSLRELVFSTGEENIVQPSRQDTRENHHGVEGKPLREE